VGHERQVASHKQRWLYRTIRPHFVEQRRIWRDVRPCRRHSVVPAPNRARIVLDVLDALVAAWGPGRVGIKISRTFAMGGFGPTEQTIGTYDYLVSRLNALPLSHLQIVRAPNDLLGTPVEPLRDTIGYFRERFRGALITNFGFDKESASSAIESGRADRCRSASPLSEIRISCGVCAKACPLAHRRPRPTIKAARKDTSIIRPLPDPRSPQTGNDQSRTRHRCVVRHRRGHRRPARIPRHQNLWLGRSARPVRLAGNAYAQTVFM
jgi:ferredoxin